MQTSNPSGQDANCLLPGCFRFYYDVYIVPQGGSSPSDFVFNSLDIDAQLIVDNVNISQNPAANALSQINAEVTEACLNGTYSTYLVTPTPGDVGFSMPEQSPPYSFPINGQPFYLFTIVVDGFPDEVIDIAVNGTYSYGTSVESMFISSSCNSVPAEVTFPQPAACTSPGTCIEFGQITGGGNIPAVIPIVVTNGANSIDEIDVKIDVSFDNFMEMPEIIGGDISASKVQVFMNTSGGYTVYAHQRSVTNSSGYLFKIQINGPVFISSGGVATLKMENARYEPQNGTCCTPCLDASEDVIFTGFSDCTDNITIRADALQGGECDEILLNLTVNWDDMDNYKDFYKLTIVCDLETSGGVSILGLGSTDIDCPTGQSYCGGSTCFEIIDANTFRYCFWSVNPVKIIKETGFQVRLNVPDGCVDNVVFREAYLDLTGGGANVACVPERFVDPADFPICSPMVKGVILTEDGDKVEGTYTIDITGPSCNYTLNPACESMYAQCVCDDNDDYTVTPFKNNNPLLGVTTFDLVLIQKHILGTQLLDSPYKIIAADANKNNSVTNQDLIELRKLILMIIENFTSNYSWRFVDKSYQFPNPANPFQTSFPETVTLTTLPGDANFVAIKIGDVNLSCTNNGNCLLDPNGEAEERDQKTGKLSIPNYSVKEGGTFTLPFNWAGEEPLAAFQCGIRFDTDALELIGPSRGQLEGLTKESFGLTQLEKGYIRTLWFSPDGESRMVGNGKELFNLSFKARRNLTGLTDVLQLDNEVLNNLAFTAEGREFSIDLNFENKPVVNELVKSLQARCQPNPFSNQLTFEVDAERPCKGSLWIFDAFGVRLYTQDINLEQGKNTITPDGIASLPPGVLTWKLNTPIGRLSGHIVKQ